MFRLRNRAIPIFLVLTLVLGGAAAADGGDFLNGQADDIAAVLADQLTGSPGGMVVGLVDEHGSRVFSVGGLDNDTDGTIDGDSIFSIGSVTKVFTVLLLMDAVRREEVALDDPLSKYLPDDVKVPSREGKQITLRSLGAQDSGLPHFPNNLFDPPLKDPDLPQLKRAADAYTVDQMYDFLSGYQLPESPGERFGYSNVGMALLGHALEQRTGKSYETLIEERIRLPLQLSSTRTTLPPELKRRLAMGHSLDGARTENWQFQEMISAGGLYSSTNDLLKFLAANLELQPSGLTPLMREMQIERHSGHPTFGRTAMPWIDENKYSPPKSRLLSHAGHGYGGYAFVALDVEQRRGVVVLTNQTAIHPNGIGWTILQGLPLSRENIAYAAREIEGIGIVLQPDANTGWPRIARVYPESPAGKAGMKPRLLVTQINGRPTKNLSVGECMRMIEESADKAVNLELRDGEDDTAASLSLFRRKFLTAMGEPIRTESDQGSEGADD